MKVYGLNWSAENKDHLICIKMKQKEIDQDIVIKMFMADQNGLQSLQKFESINFMIIFMFLI